MASPSGTGGGTGTPSSTSSSANGAKSKMALKQGREQEQNQSDRPEPPPSSASSSTASTPSRSKETSGVKSSWCPPRFSSVSDNEVEGNIYMHNPKALPIRMINWYQVFQTHYLSHIYIAVIAFLIYFAPNELFFVSELGYKAVETFGWSRVVLVVLLPLILYRSSSWGPHWRSSVYLIDFECAAPPEDWRMTVEQTKKMLENQRSFTDESKEFQHRILNTSGIGDGTAWPPCILNSLGGKSVATSRSDSKTSASSGGSLYEYASTMQDARDETETIVFDMVERLLARTKTKAKNIDFLVVNCSLFCPTPSICAMIANKFKMKEDINSFNLGGMGCSAGVISIDLAKQLIQNKPGATALVVSTENLSQNLYTGNDRSMMMQNTLFRCGGAAVLLSSNSYNYNTKRFAKYKLLHSGRTFMTDDESFKCVYQEEDNLPSKVASCIASTTRTEGEGTKAEISKAQSATNNNIKPAAAAPSGDLKGVRLQRNIVTVAGRALTKQFTQLGPNILPVSEQAKTIGTMVADYLCKNFLHILSPKHFPPRVKIYTPNFKKCIDHFCIHAGGRAVIEGVQKNLKLTDRDVEPSFMTLKKWGNTSSSSIWYELQFIEDSKRIKHGHQVLQIAFGSGFKCNSAVWLRL
ncbi:unnamed protein product [Amoebophrya sp. A120]|nr:unnamed protein product [Amoebophrya sp. A120]|eukprot:GSA120T00005854001.1